ncbi:MAG TPA: cytochrome c [Puia sp.]|nr:cytochrome c [Puia sp.]
MKFSRISIVILSSAVVFAACGGGSEKNASAKDTTANTTPTASAPATTGNASDDKAIELIAGSDCTTCHRLHQADGGASIGPAYDQVAAKYSPAADSTVDRLVKKVISGGSGIWGTTPMTPHPQMKPDDVKTIVTFILTLKK